MSLIEKRLYNFIAWIKPDEETAKKTQKKAHEIRTTIAQYANRDRFVVVETRNAGSFVKCTGLRRHITGGSLVEGQDVDLAFILRDAGVPHEEVLRRFQSYADQAYPGTSPRKSATKSSIKIEFRNARMSFDLVPLLSDAPDHSYQRLHRLDGSSIRTSVQRHVDFTRSRTARTTGYVRYNHCVRLMKWWREFQQVPADRVGNVSSFMMDLLCAYALDHYKVADNYHLTLLNWFQKLGELIANRSPVYFNKAPAKTSSAWQVLDPVDGTNNIAYKWVDQNVDALAGWFRTAAVRLQEAIRQDQRSHYDQSLGSLKLLFGSPFKQYCDDETATRGADGDRYVGNGDPT